MCDFVLVKSRHIKDRPRTAKTSKKCHANLLRFVKSGRIMNMNKVSTTATVLRIIMRLSAVFFCCVMCAVIAVGLKQQPACSAQHARACVCGLIDSICILHTARSITLPAHSTHERQVCMSAYCATRTRCSFVGAASSITTPCINSAWTAAGRLVWLSADRSMSAADIRVCVSPVTSA